MKKFDWYIFRRFFLSFVLAISLLVLIIVLFDLSEKIDRFIEKKAPFSEILLVYYFNFIPYFVNLFIALFVFITVIFVTSRMAMHGETVAIFTSGVSFNRYLRPFLCVAFLLFVFSLYLQNFAIPPANKKRFDFEWKYIKRNKPFGSFNIYMQLSQNTYFSLETYSFSSNIGYMCYIIQMDFEKGLHRMVFAQTISYDTSDGKWILMNGYERTIGPREENIYSFEKKDSVLPLHPRELHKDFENTDVMNFFQLEHFIERQRERASDRVPALLVEKHRRLAFPFATIILTILGVAIGSRRVRGGTGFHIGLGLGLSFTYILFMQIFSSLGISGDLPPLIATWMPNIIFAIVALIAVRFAQK
ncbi:MAG: LptF/LptG family permease [Bacteroidales bacterium]|nr:LptF/LptG family permease [Bacteroidales bacterium]